ncbi:uncharacterized protein LOC123529788 [Mercenaria mercenaria]|uniref:uncharacterized protein LOC123529788 n=1 Tax=Mercenaria mercenaria TaxID=6596 RepID=UPI00234EB884|nr:uncharacterized protein LOC123529788 [Mercenaria mercenaria]
MCCTYSVYKLPSLYWSLKLREHKTVIEKATYNSIGDFANRVYQGIDSDSATSLEQKQSVDERYRTASRTDISTSSYNTSSPSFQKGREMDGELVTNLRLSSSGNKSNSESVKLDFPKQQNVTSSKNSNDIKADNRKVMDNIYDEELENLLKEIDEGVAADIKYNTVKEDNADGEFIFENEDIEFDLNDINEYQRTSENLFNTFPNHQNATKYLIYFCEGKCGGLADRLKGIAMVYMMSILAERRFAISMETPCQIENFLQPNILDWRFPANKEMTGKTLDYMEHYHEYTIDFQKLDPDPISLLKDDVVLMKANQDWTRIFRKMSVSPKRFPQLYQYHSSELLRTIYTGLFKPSNELKHLIDEFFEKNVNGKKIACLHARMGEEAYKRYTYQEIMIPLLFMKRFDNMDDYKIMVATDTDKVKKIARHLFKNVIDTSGPILHIDHMGNGTMPQDLKCAGFMRTMVDHMVLQRCDKLVITGSGFGVTAASIRHTSSGLHVYVRGNSVMPTRRELVRETFQWRCLSYDGDRNFYNAICDT